MFDREIFKAVVGEIGDTHEHEKLGCDECFELVDRFIEAELSGLTAAKAAPLVHEHLYICGECRDEFKALLDALQATEDPSSPTTEALERLHRSVTPGYAR
jgi:predicted anti-sigma-YlaC factor YlaD